MPGLIHRLSILPAAAALLFPLGVASAQQALTVERVRAIVASAADEFPIQGMSLAVIQDGEVLIETAVGEAADGRPMTPATLCNIASCSKAFTAAAVAMLVDAGELEWDDKVVEHLPEFRLSDPWITANMTIRDLLCHRCGLKTFAGDLLWYGTDYSDDEVIRRMARLPITQNFREQFGYQNLMYLVAGKVVERKTGQSWSAFVQQRLLTPLGMEQSRPAAQDLPADADKALPHIGGEVIADHEFVACKPAASIYSSVHELTAWMRMLLNGGKWNGKQLLSQPSVIEMWRPQTHLARTGAGPRVDDFESYGLGWFLSIDHGDKVVEHDGGMPGFLSKVSLMPAKRFAFAVLNNGNDGVLNEAIKRALYAELAGGDGVAIVQRLGEIKKRIDRRSSRERAAREARRRQGTAPSHQLDEYVGSYRDEIYGDATVSRTDDGALHVVLEPAAKRLYGTMRHWHDDTFRVDFPDRFLPFALVRFELDADSRVVAFHIDCPIADFDFGQLDFRRVPE
ncbi:MAG: serine hydrolase [Planctomycetes bacterium]|nr:serine hydrolase [Planctomycetota bacterium]